MMKHASQIVEEWLAWPGKPFHWQKCDSPIEDCFLHHLHKYTSDQVDLTTQHEIVTDSGMFRLDFLLRHRTTGRAVGIECDGQAYHSFSKDTLRDQAILRTSQLARIYRLPGKDLYYHGIDVVHLLSQLEPWLVGDHFHQFSEDMCGSPELYSDDRGTLEGGYSGIRRSYFEYVLDDEEYDPYVECDCLHDCDCRAVREVTRSRTRTPTVIRFMTGKDHPSAHERPEHLAPVPMPEWKREVARAIHEQAGQSGTQHALVSPASS